MHRHLTGQLFKALLLGFLCCLGSAAKDIPDKSPAVLPFALKEVHPNSAALVAAIEAGTVALVPGYKIYRMRVTDHETNQMIGEEPILLNRKSIVVMDSIQTAIASGEFGVVAVKLTNKDGERLANANGRMTLLQDRIAVVFESKCLTAPTVVAKLDRNFTVAGLHGKKEVDRIVKALNASIKKASKKINFQDPSQS
ncbi:MAG: hypothetical protein ACJAVK_001082 [Akkermansiaceae bacterium]|jgi:hypothetical protein